MPKIFISSTSEDLVEHRKRLMETLRRMQLDGIAMEAFSAQPDTPVEVCKREVRSADLVVLVLAHRYGWIPSTEQGGDGERSITRIEYDQASQPSHGEPKPVLAFIVDDKAEWTSKREQDALVDAPTQADALKIYAAAQALKRFKSEVGSALVRDTFSTPADLADKAGTAIARWLLKRQTIVQRDVAVELKLHGLLEKVAELLREGLHELALTYLEDATQAADAANLPAIADKRLEILAPLSLMDARLIPAAERVVALSGKRVALAQLLLGKSKSQRSRKLWASDRQAAWVLADEARSHLGAAIVEDKFNPDVYGTLGGLLKRQAQWAGELFPSEVQPLEDAMLAAYKSGWERVPDAYPLLNYIEQRAVLADQREPSSTGRELIDAGEVALRDSLYTALRTREGQLGLKRDRPWAAFDLARGRHYLNPNVPGFLEDLELACDEARSVALSADDRYMVDTTRESLQALLHAKVRLEGLPEAIDLLERAVASKTWHVDRPRRSIPYLERELMELQTTLTEYAHQQLFLSVHQQEQVTNFIKAAEVRWKREDEELFQQELVEWKRALEPKELKVLRALWKVFGRKGLDALSGVIPVDFKAAVELVRQAKR